MNNIEFIKNFNPTKLIGINSIKIINDIENSEKYYKTTLQGSISINIECNEWSLDKFLYQINEIGMMFSEVFIHNSSTSNFSCLDEFMYYTRLIQSDNINSIERFPFKKEEELSKKDFIENYNLYFNEIFLENKDILIEIDYRNFEEGYFYFNEPSTIVMGCKLNNLYWGFIYNPYI